MIAVPVLPTIHARIFDMDGYLVSSEPLAFVTGLALPAVAFGSSKVHSRP
jgi:hypothetical protein